MARPTLTEAQIQAGRRRLCAAALKVYRSKGYDAITLRELASVARISHATPYRYFASKEELFGQLRAAVFVQFHQHLRAADPGGDDPLLRLRRVVEAMVDFAEQAPEDYRLIFPVRQAPPEPGTPLHAAIADALDYVVGLCQEAIDAGLLEGDALTHMHLAWASIHGLLSLHVGSLLAQGRRLEQLVQPMIDRLFPLPAKPVRRRRGRA